MSQSAEVSSCDERLGDSTCCLWVPGIVYTNFCMIKWRYMSGLDLDPNHADRILQLCISNGYHTENYPPLLWLLLTRFATLLCMTSSSQKLALIYQTAYDTMERNVAGFLLSTGWDYRTCVLMCKLSLVRNWEWQAEYTFFFLIVGPNFPLHMWEHRGKMP